MSNHSSKNTLLYLIQTKYPSISSIFVFLAQSFGNSFAQYYQSYAFAAARPELQATNASFKYSSCIQASKFNLLLVCTRLVSKKEYPTRARLCRMLSSNERRKGGCHCKAICRRFVVKCRIGVNATDCISLMPNALKSNAELNARVQAWGIKKCYSYSIRCNATR